jgi:hypothetical protein
MPYGARIRLGYNQDKDKERALKFANKKPDPFKKGSPFFIYVLAIFTLIFIVIFYFNRGCMLP